MILAENRQKKERLYRSAKALIQDDETHQVRPMVFMHRSRNTEQPVTRGVKTPSRDRAYNSERFWDQKAASVFGGLKPQSL